VKYKKEIKTGIIVVLAVALFIYGFNFLKGRNIFSSDMDLYAIYSEANGITANNTVQINGFKVGTVREVSLDPKTNKILVHFIITDKNAIITKGSTAEIFSDGLLGYKGIRLSILAGGKQVEDGDTLVGSNETGLKDQVSEMVLPLKRKLESLVSSIDSVVIIFQSVLGDSSRDDIVASFSSIRITLENLKNTSTNINGMVADERVKFSAIMTNVQSITSNLAKNNDHISRAMANLDNITDSLAKSNLKQTIANTNLALQHFAEIMAKVNSGQGSMGMLVNDKKLYEELTKSSTDLDALLIDIKTYPGRYFSIFGRKDKPKKKTGTTP
jgi:phospholipid/cholesterol/gamma-HCH transport system substrate-binding protein